MQNLEDKVVYQNLQVSTPLLDSPQFAWYGHPRIYGLPHRLPLLTQRTNGKSRDLPLGMPARKRGLN